MVYLFSNSQALYDEKSYSQISQAPLHSYGIYVREFQMLTYVESVQVKLAKTMY